MGREEGFTGSEFRRLTTTEHEPMTTGCGDSTTQNDYCKKRPHRHAINHNGQALPSTHNQQQPHAQKTAAHKLRAYMMASMRGNTHAHSSQATHTKILCWSCRAMVFKVPVSLNLKKKKKNFF